MQLSIGAVHVATVLLYCCILSTDLCTTAAATNTDQHQGVDDVYSWMPSHGLDRRSPSMRLRFGKRDYWQFPMENDLLGNDSPVSLKDTRSPQLRLRFGKRNPGEILPFHELGTSDIDEAIEQKSIRSPQLRLRFGKRAQDDVDQEWPTDIQNAALLDELLAPKAMRSPQLRLRFGKRENQYGELIPLVDLANQIENKDTRSPKLRLRFGKRNSQISDLDNDTELSDQVEQKSIRSPQLRLRFGKRENELEKSGTEYSGSDDGHQ